MTEYRPKLGDTVEYMRTKRFGKIMGFEGPYVQLRPVGGGREWDADPGDLRLLMLMEALSAGVAAANKRSKGERL
ncbi:hypothetical protein [Streptomyces capitiformicae]|uniref:Uncharacterized protein n=1 Tax=Streptomyces capitiformicae TaxID=2014920 RepID=A0A918ZT17_9ACTN|nr:hypothetical protein [Streptomyces capitiformicae]GHE68594.1 hypothetical protein GCM10017771_92380 [Streptomyces capitiformicae]